MKQDLKSKLYPTPDYDNVIQDGSGWYRYDEVEQKWRKWPYEIGGNWDGCGKYLSATQLIMLSSAPFCEYCHTRHFGYQDHDMA